MRVSTSGHAKDSALSATRPSLFVQISFREYTLRSMTYVSSCPITSHSKTNTVWPYGTWFISVYERITLRGIAEVHTICLKPLGTHSIPLSVQKPHFEPDSGPRSHCRVRGAQLRKKKTVMYAWLYPLCDAGRYKPYRQPCSFSLQLQPASKFSA